MTELKKIKKSYWINERFLTSAAKAHIIAEWKMSLAKPLPAGNLAGKGWPDPEIIPLCERLNALPGVCTLQSCSGHGAEGHLWIWLDEVTSHEFNRWGHILSRMGGIETVSRRYTDWGQEITAIQFDKNFKEAYKSVLMFFHMVVTRRKYHSFP